MRLFTHPEVAQWKQKATQLESDNQRLQRKLEEAYQQISELRQSEWELQRQIRNAIPSRAPLKNDPSYEGSQLQRMLHVIQRFTQMKPLRKLQTKSGLDLLFFTKGKVDSLIQDCGENPKIIIPKLAGLGLIEKQEGFQYACRVEGEVIRGYALVRDRILWFAHDALKPLVEGD